MCEYKRKTQSPQNKSKQEAQTPRQALHRMGNQAAQTPRQALHRMGNQAALSALGLQSASDGVPLEDAMRARFERQFGLPMDDVRIHSNSERPSAFDADAFTYGHDIYLGPGQESLLPHEMTHVAQQKLGQVHPTGMEHGLAVNHSSELEHIADMGTLSQTTAGSASGPVVQCGKGDHKEEEEEEDAGLVELTDEEKKLFIKENFKGFSMKEGKVGSVYFGGTSVDDLEEGKKKEIEDLANQYMYRKKELQTLGHAYEELKDQEKSLSKLKDRLSARQKHWVLKNNNLKLDIEAYHKRLSSAKQKKNQLQAQKKQLEGETLSLEKEKTQLKAQKKQLKGEILSLEKEKTQLEAQEKQLKADQQQLEDVKRAVEHQYDTKKIEFYKIKTRLTEQVKENGSIGGRGRLTHVHSGEKSVYSNVLRMTDPKGPGGALFEVMVNSHGNLVVHTSRGKMVEKSREGTGGTPDPDQAFVDQFANGFSTEMLQLLVQKAATAQAKMEPLGKRPQTDTKEDVEKYINNVFQINQKLVEGVEELAKLESSEEAKSPASSGEAKSSETSGEAKSPEPSEEAKSPEPSGEAKSPETSGEAKSSETSEEAKSPEPSEEAKSPASSGEPKSPETSKPENPKKDQPQDQKALIEELIKRMYTPEEIKDQMERKYGVGHN